MVGTANHIGRIGAMAVAMGVGRFRPVATRMTVSIGVAAVVLTAAAVSVPVPTVSPAVKLSADSTALLLCGISCPKWNDAHVEVIMDQFITPIHPGRTITPIAVTAPGEAWPITGLFRLLEFAFGDPSIGRPGGDGWPDEPWWKLSGLVDITGNQSIEAGVADLEEAMAGHPSDHLVVYGYSLGAVIAAKEKRKLAERYPEGTIAPDIDFVLAADVGVPNGGFGARFPGLHIPILDWSYDGAHPTDTQFDTVVITRQYDGFADFPLYPLNIIADLNAVLGLLYVHTWPFDVSLPEDPTTSPAYQGTHGDSSYYFFETENLPLFNPLRSLGVPEPLIDVIEPFFRVLVELGYDRSIPPWEPTPARLIPTLNPVTVTTDLVAAIGEGIDNAAALVGLPQLRMPAPVTPAAPATETVEADMSTQVTSRGSAIATRQMSMATETLTATVTEAPEVGASPQGAATELVTETDPPTTAQTVADTEQSTSSNAARASTSKPAKPRPLVRDSLGVVQQPRGRSERGEGDHLSTRTTAGDDGAGTGEPSSTAASSTASSSAGGASAGDSDGS